MNELTLNFFKFFSLPLRYMRVALNSKIGSRQGPHDNIASRQTIMQRLKPQGICTTVNAPKSFARTD